MISSSCYGVGGGNVTFLVGFFEEDDDTTLCRSPWFEDCVVRQARRLLEEFELSLDGLYDTVSLLTDSLLLSQQDQVVMNVVGLHE